MKKIGVRILTSIPLVKDEAKTQKHHVHTHKHPPFGMSLLGMSLLLAFTVRSPSPTELSPFSNNSIAFLLEFYKDRKLCNIHGSKLKDFELS
jgi:hypothetical protein